MNVMKYLWLIFLFNEVLNQTNGRKIKENCKRNGDICSSQQICCSRKCAANGKCQ